MTNILTLKQEGFKKLKDGAYLGNKILYASFHSPPQRKKNDKIYLGKTYKSKQMDFCYFWTKQ